MLKHIADAMLSARATLQEDFNKLHKVILAIVWEDAVCRKILMSAPSVGPVVAITFKSAVDDPTRIDLGARRLGDACRRPRRGDYTTRPKWACPSSRMRLRDLTAMATSVTRRASSRDFNVSPMTRL